MGKTAVALYETSTEAQQVLRDLVKAGFERNTIRIMLGDASTRRIHEWHEESEPVSGSRSEWDDDGVSAILSSVGVPHDDAEDYEEALHRGHALVSVSTTDQRINEAVEIMSRHNILDIHERKRSWNMTTGKERNLKSGKEERLPVIEEEVRVGKREVERGGVRVSAHVTDTPVDKTVNLREEHVNVERRPVDRPASQGDVDKLRDQTIEVRESAEEAVVDKQARVVEEVVVRKDTETHQEQIHDTVRRTDVDVENIGGPEWNRFSDEFRTHYKSNFAKGGRDFSYYEPAYRYGYSLAARPEYRAAPGIRLSPMRGASGRQNTAIRVPGMSSRTRYATLGTVSLKPHPHPCMTLTSPGR